MSPKLSNQFRNKTDWNFPGDPGAETPHSQCRGPGLIPGWGARSCMLHTTKSSCLPWLKMLHAATKAQHSEMNLKKKKKEIKQTNNDAFYKSIIFFQINASTD